MLYAVVCMQPSEQRDLHSSQWRAGFYQCPWRGKKKKKTGDLAILDFNETSEGI